MKKYNIIYIFSSILIIPLVIISATCTPAEQNQIAEQPKIETNQIKIVSMDILPTIIYVGDNLTITLTINNEGNTKANGEIKVKIDSREIYSEVIELDTKATQNININAGELEQGEHTISAGTEKRIIKVEHPGTIAFTKYDTANKKWNILSVDANGKNKNKIIESRYINNPAWSQDGRQIVFESNEDAARRGRNNRSIYTASNDGQNMRLLTNPDTDTILPCWSPDSRVIAYCENHEQYIFIGETVKYDICVTDVNTTDRQQITFKTSGAPGSGYYSPSFFPDNNRIACFYTDGGNWDIHILHVSGNTGDTEKILIHGKFKQQEYDEFGNVYGGPNLSVSPDGNYIIFDHKQEELRNIYILDLKTNTIKQLTSNAGYNIQPCFSPTGDKIAFASNRSMKEADWKLWVLSAWHNAFDIYTMNVDGTNVKRITFDGGRKPTWRR